MMTAIRSAMALMRRLMAATAALAWMPFGAGLWTWNALTAHNRIPSIGELLDDQVARAARPREPEPRREPTETRATIERLREHDLGSDIQNYARALLNGEAPVRGRLAPALEMWLDSLDRLELVRVVQSGPTTIAKLTAGVATVEGLRGPNPSEDARRVLAKAATRAKPATPEARLERTLRLVG